MPTLNPAVEFERARNSIFGFGWEIIERKIEPDLLIIRAFKNRDPKRKIPENLDIDRIVALFSGLGWSMRSQSSDQTKLYVEVQRPVPAGDVALPS